ncbi:TSSK6-activating co-chaperone protein isoform X2 [Microtus pennsylvanicus]|uniref:TSSK6-activating co-chaperone protein isoform X2 n=1 Tax=Microtus pennsylvanicus TaxID=10058 RepID=UPI003F6A9554
MEQQTSNPTDQKAKEEDNAVCLCPAKPSPSFINLQANSLPATFLNIQTTELPSEPAFGQRTAPALTTDKMHSVQTG